MLDELSSVDMLWVESQRLVRELPSHLTVAISVGDQSGVVVRLEHQRAESTCVFDERSSLIEIAGSKFEQLCMKEMRRPRKKRR